MASGSVTGIVRGPVFAVARNGASVTTVEGNARLGGIEGVIGNTYPVAKIDQAIRIQANDLE